MTEPTTRLDDLLRAALAEDLGEAGDVTTSALVPETAESTGRIVARAPGVVAGLSTAARVFELVDPATRAEARCADGDCVQSGAVLLELSGPARAILSGERTALNLLGRLCGIATATRALVDAVEGTGAAVVDTRKTTPLLRELEKAAVVAGGGANHRMGLFDAVLIKDNHLAAVGSPAEAVEKARARWGAEMRVEVEIESVDELEPSIAAGADIVMLDNMEIGEMRRAVEIADGRCLLEASGGITLGSIREVAETGVDWISVGWITHSAPSLDVSLELDR